MVSAVIAASPNRIFAAWMDERKHTAITGVRAMIDPWVGGRYSGGDGTVIGRFVHLDTGRRIVMTWRSTDFPREATDSTVEVHFDPVAGGTRVAVRHSDIPEGLVDGCKQIWRTQYFERLKKFFGSPGGLRAALEAASKAGKLPRPGLTRAAPGSAMVRSRPGESAHQAVLDATSRLSKPAKKKSPMTAVKKSASAKASPAEVQKVEKPAKKAAAKKTTASSTTGGKKAPKKSAATRKAVGKKSAAKRAAPKKTARKGPAKSSAKSTAKRKATPSKKASRKKAPARKKSSAKRK